mmetsp:Transcript_20702/g.58256  ORF Transcript_20702/g.58256 Transcript_20702/m.58256 type:complete len:274 (-) Transcript_20702:591-1412(-)
MPRISGLGSRGPADCNIGGVSPGWVPDSAWGAAFPTPTRRRGPTPIAEPALCCGRKELRLRRSRWGGRDRPAAVMTVAGATMTGTPCCPTSSAPSASPGTTHCARENRGGGPFRDVVVVTGDNKRGARGERESGPDFSLGCGPPGTGFLSCVRIAPDCPRADSSVWSLPVASSRDMRFVGVRGDDSSFLRRSRSSDDSGRFPSLRPDTSPSAPCPIPRARSPTTAPALVLRSGASRVHRNPIFSESLISFRHRRSLRSLLAARCRFAPLRCHT